MIQKKISISGISLPKELERVESLQPLKRIGVNYAQVQIRE